MPSFPSELQSERGAVGHLILAVRFLTIVPVPGREAAGPAALGRAAWWFPAVGLALGACLVAADHLFAVVFPPRLGSILLVSLWKILTGGIHLDGLADVLDGLSGRDADRRLAPLLIGPLFPAAAPGQGTGASFLEGLSPWAAPVSIVGLWILSAVLLGPWGGLLLSLVLAVVLLWAVFLASRLGGLTGDALGSSVELAELATLVAAAALIHLRVL